MRPTPEDRLEQTLDAWGRAAAQSPAAMPEAITGAVTTRRRVRRAQQGVGTIAIIALVLGLVTWLNPAQAPVTTSDDQPLRAGAPSPRLIDIQRANPALDLDNLRLPETKFSGVRESLGLRPYTPAPATPDQERLTPPDGQ